MGLLRKNPPRYTALALFYFASGESHRQPASFSETLEEVVLTNL